MVNTVVSTTIKNHGGLAVLVNNAGIMDSFSDSASDKGGAIPPVDSEWSAV